MVFLIGCTPAVQITTTAVEETKQPVTNFENNAFTVYPIIGDTEYKAFRIEQFESGVTRLKVRLERSGKTRWG
jgi:hypothetical protein